MFGVMLDFHWSRAFLLKPAKTIIRTRETAARSQERSSQPHPSVMLDHGSYAVASDLREGPLKLNCRAEMIDILHQCYGDYLLLRLLTFPMSVSRVLI